jgi:hypothetical protein
MDIRFWIYAGLLFACGAGIRIVREVMTEEADERLPENEKIPRTMWNRTGFESGEMSRMREAHQQFFPDNRLRFWYVSLWVFAILWMFFGFGILQGILR